MACAVHSWGHMVPLVITTDELPDGGLFNKGD